MAKAWLISDEAQQDIDDIIENIVEYTSWTSTGIKLYSELYEKFELIASLPKCGRQRFDDTREIFTRSYRIVLKNLKIILKLLL
mgnify:CR=1 FL=1|jgi:toxin ParE1/3/4